MKATRRRAPSRVTILHTAIFSDVMHRNFNRLHNTRGMYMNPVSSNFDCRDRATQSTINGLSGMRNSSHSLVRTREGKPDTMPSTRAVDECWYKQRKTKENPSSTNTQMVKGQRERDKGAGIHKGVTGKRQQKMASSWWVLTLSLCRGLGGEVQEST